MSIFQGRFIEDVYEDSTYAGTIAVYNDIIKNPEEIIKQIEKSVENEESSAQWSGSPTYNNVTNDGIISDYRSSKSIPITSIAKSGENTFKKIHNEIYDVVWSAAIPYIYKFNIEGFIDSDYFDILKYSSGDKYNSHYDGPTITGRSVSILIYLNDNYSGGEIEFDFFDLKIKPTAGSMIIFPSNYAYRHTAHPVIDGEKYVIVSWLKDRQTDI